VPDPTATPGECAVCGCTDAQPCLGGVVFPPRDPGPHRMVDAPDLLAPGETCGWLDEEETVCSAHSAEELVAAGLLDAPPELGEASHG
jgi:hypothetical protein